MATKGKAAPAVKSSPRRQTDANAVKLPKPIKVMAATYLDKHARSAFIRSHVEILLAEKNKVNNKRGDK